ncbi:MAG: phosphoribosyltransferase [Clostridia bacterium]|nr:MAG: phosphoribosyltransferase [Clostridia bacterium]
MFTNRFEAGQQLAVALAEYRGQDLLILAIPRGGVEVAAPVAQALEAELDLVVPRKIGAPFNPEMALGAVTQDGIPLLDQVLLIRLGLTPEDLAGAISREVAEAKRRLREYRGSRPQPQVTGRVVVVIDDGVATGFTTRAALTSVRRESPARLVLAVPVGPPNTLAELEREVDSLVCPLQPDPFYAVGQFYEDFGQTSDVRVIELLQENWARWGARGR